jgi:flagellar M-ring protein FliF
LLDHEGVTTSEFVEHVDYQRALETELDSTIGSIQGVQSAQVNLAIPQDNVFTDDSQKVTGAVLLALTPGTTLTTAQVRSVVNLVSSSVPGLSATNVSVSDSTGQVLSAAGTGVSAGGAVSTDAEATAAYDTQVSTSVQQMLDHVLGTGHSSVTVNAVLDFDNSTTSAHSYTYSSGVPPLAVSSQSEGYSGNGNAGGTLGVATAAVPTPSATGTANDYSNTSVTQNNAVGTQDTTVVTQPGSVQHLNVAVVVDKAALNSISQADLESLVSSAAGAVNNADRKDDVVVKALPFDTTAAKQAALAATAAKKAAAAKASSDSMVSLIKTGGVVLLAVIVVVLTAVMSRRRRNEPLEPVSEVDNFLAQLDGPEPADIPKEPAMRPLPVSAIENERNRRMVSELAGDQPEDVTRLLRNWMNTKG